MTSRASLTTAIGGLCALAAAMGLGRFLFTPILPLMSDATGMSAHQAGLIASANFAGYLAGALLAALPGLPGNPRVWMLTALAASAVTTACMAFDAPIWGWAALRFAGGLASALVLVFASSLVMRRLQATGDGALSAFHFAGVGTGILISALIASPWLMADGAWREIWLAGGALTLVALVIVALMIPSMEAPAESSNGGAALPPGLWRIVAAYGCLGFGYVITATFIVAILRESGGGRIEETLLWSLVGLAAIPSIAFWTWLGRRGDGIRIYQAAMLLQAIGVAISIMGSGGAMLAAALLLGGTFMGLTALGFQEAAKRSGGDGRAVMALMTACFGIGQMIGPAMAGWLRETTGSYTAPTLIAALVLILGAAVIQPLVRRA